MKLEGNQLMLYKEILIKTFCAFKDFCKENNITYYACGGTAIGAVRHQGIIPWDDDIDVFMYRDEYDRFISLKKKLAADYEILSFGDEGYPLTFAKFCDKNTVIWEHRQLPCTWGVFIDVFPLDAVTGKDKATLKIQKKYYYLSYKYLESFKKIAYIDIYNAIQKQGIKEAAKLIRIKFLDHFLRNVYRKKIENIITQSKQLPSTWVMNFYTPYAPLKEICPTEWFKEPTEVPFENTTICIGKGNHHYLTQLYGNYMTPPPKEKQVSHHGHYYYNLSMSLSVDEIKKLPISKTEQNLHH